MLFHIISTEDWQQAQESGEYSPTGFAQEGFIHLSKKEQILRPANLLYKGRDDLALLVIDPTLVANDVVFEPGSHGETEHFPHLYGSLNLNAVVDVVPFPCVPESGSFELPDGLAG